MGQEKLHLAALCRVVHQSLAAGGLAGANMIYGRAGLVSERTRVLPTHADTGRGLITPCSLSLRRAD